ncbi:MAG: hypothetical protein ACI8W7_000082, partial [Gammaproteobacteria bacterium]
MADSDLACVDDCASAATEPGTPFLAHLHEIRDIALLGSDDIVGLVQPLLEQVVATHEQGLVAPLDGVDSLRVSMGHLWYLNSKATASRNN